MFKVLGLCVENDKLAVVEESKEVLELNSNRSENDFQLLFSISSFSSILLNVATASNFF